MTTIVVIFPTDCCITKPWSSSTIPFNNTSIAWKHHTNNNPYFFQPTDQLINWPTDQLINWSTDIHRYTALIERVPLHAGGGQEGTGQGKKDKKGSKRGKKGADTGASDSNSHSNSDNAPAIPAIPVIIRKPVFPRFESKESVVAFIDELELEERNSEGKSIQVIGPESGQPRFRPRCSEDSEYDMNMIWIWLCCQGRGYVDMIVYNEREGYVYGYS